MLQDLLKDRLPTPEEALPGRDEAPVLNERHYVTGHRILPPLPEGLLVGMFGMGCFWGAERRFWEAPGVYSTAVGYAGGYTPNPTYQEVCTGLTGHAEVVKVAYDPAEVSYADLLTLFWEGHDPTQGMRQGNDHGTQYRSVIFTFDSDQRSAAEVTRRAYQRVLSDEGYARITTEIEQGSSFYYAEEYHQQYLAKNPGGYCGMGGTGVSCPTGVSAK